MKSEKYKNIILRVDLARKKFEKEEIDQSKILKFIGGRGLGAKILFDELKPGTDPQSPDNKLIFLAGPMIGTGAPWAPKYCVETKSPLTGTILMSLAGGFFGAGMRNSGYDGFILEGRSEEPDYLWINDGKVEFRKASHLRGKLTDDCQETIRQELGGDKNIQIACIGPAGEKGVRFASIISGYRAVGRGGAGLVLASKNLQAIAVNGTRKVPLVQPGPFRELQTAIRKKARGVERLVMFGKYGTPRNQLIVNERGLFPTRNYQGGMFEGIHEVSYIKQQERLIRKTTCHSCPVACGNLTKARAPYEGFETEGPEYETFWAFGAHCGNTNIDAVIAADRLCDQFGMDTISTGNGIGFAMECAEKGLLSKADLGGLDLKFGNHQAMVEMVRRIGNRQGLGDLLAEGTRRAAEKIGGNSIHFAMQVKGMEIPAYDPRGAKSMALTYSTSPRGGCHERGLISRETFGTPPYLDPLSIEGKGAVAQFYHDRTAFLDSLGYCIFPPNNGGMDFQEVASLFSFVVGEPFPELDLFKAGERIWNLERLFNFREGLTGKDDALPPRLLKEPMPAGPAKGHIVELDTLLKDYYKVRNWDEKGVPRPEKLKELDLEEEGKAALGWKKT
ncbi:MAG: aldehyde ferredoxin oxidoreductase family protein [Deltaproteobacteria bacterium]|nr:aldehyde ferredoxin oxidoreductase family protein [Deltaproteobacteria bacterium]